MKTKNNLKKSIVPLYFLATILLAEYCGGTPPSSVPENSEASGREHQEALEAFTNKYDDGSWHSGGDFPKDLPDDAGATHIGMFVAWALLSDLSGDVHELEEIVALREQAITPGQFFIWQCDNKLTHHDFNDEGNAFAMTYYERGQYFEDYCDALGGSLPSFYHVPDTWSTYEILRPILDRRLEEWRDASH